jgi:3-oxoacyl-[acyl-carrier protein] reductase
MPAARRALVTGGSGALGGALCRQLARAGHFVYVHAHRHAEAAEATAASIRAQGGAAEALVFDVTDAGRSRAILEALVEASPIQILINNAGVHEDAVFPGMSWESWQRVLSVSVDGFYNVTQPLMLPMIGTRWGRIVNISSVTALIGNRGQVNYAAAKGALNAATRALALEVASRGVTVNAVAPGILADGMAAAAFDAEMIRTRVPMKRAGTLEEVASLVGYLVSEDAGYLTGQIISVSGGIA